MMKGQIILHPHGFVALIECKKKLMNHVHNRSVISTETCNFDTKYDFWYLYCKHFLQCWWIYNHLIISHIHRFYICCKPVFTG